MSRTGRLMRLMEALRRLPRPVAAARLAAQSGVSRRQLCRDIATLRAGGALIDGEAGVGHALTEAGEDAVARILATLPPSQGRHALHATLRLFRPAAERPAPQGGMALPRQAMRDETSLVIDHVDLARKATRPEIWPLGPSYSDSHLMLLAHCRLRGDFRVFHLAGIPAMRPGGTSFRPRRVALLRDHAAGPPQ